MSSNHESAGYGQLTPPEPLAEALLEEQSPVFSSLPADHQPGRFDDKAKHEFNLTALNTLAEYVESLNDSDGREVVDRVREISQRRHSEIGAPPRGVEVGNRANERYRQVNFNVNDTLLTRDSILIPHFAYANSQLRATLLLQPRIRRPETYDAWRTQVGHEGAKKFGEAIVLDQLADFIEEQVVKPDIDATVNDYRNQLATKQTVSVARQIVRQKLQLAEALFIDDDSEDGDNNQQIIAEALTELHALRQSVLFTGKSTLYNQAIDTLTSVGAQAMRTADREFSRLCWTYLSNPTDTLELQHFLSASQHVDMRKYVMGYEMMRVADELTKLKPAADELRSVVIAHYAELLEETFDRKHIDLLFAINVETMRTFGLDYALPELKQSAAGGTHEADPLSVDDNISENDSEPVINEWPSTLETQLTQLDWEVLPPGELQQKSVEIVEEFNERQGSTGAVVDLSRLRILDNIRQEWGPDRCYYTRGHRKGRGSVKDESGAQQPDEYIILVLQETDAKGNVVHENAVAESPIAGPNALYIYRPDATEHGLGWRAVMSLDKQSARNAGARNLRHRVTEGRDLISDMTEKTLVLLTADPHTFNYVEFAGVTAEGDIATRLKLGKVALSQ